MKRRNIIVAIIVMALLVSIYISKPLELNYSGMLFDSGILVALFVGILLQFVANYLRAMKTKLLIERIRPISTQQIFRSQMLGLFFNLILPLRLGEVLRARFIANGAIISQSAVFSTIVFERTLDILAIGTVSTLVILYTSGLNLIMLILPVALMILAFLSGLLILLGRNQSRFLLLYTYKLSGLFNDRLKNKMRMMAWSAIFTLKNVISSEIMARYLTLTLLSWSAFYLSIYVLLRLILENLDIISIIQAVNAAYLAISVPAWPAYLGTFQLIFTAESGLSIQTLHSNNITFFTWLIIIASPLSLGVFYLFKKSEKISTSKDISQALKNKLHRDTDITEQFAQFLDAYFKGDEINKIITLEEQAHNFQVIKTFTGGSKALTILAWQDDKMIVKKITLKQFQNKLQAQYEWLAERSNIKHVAKVIGEESTSDAYYSIDIEYRDEYIPFFDIIHSSTEEINSNVLMKVCTFMSNKIYTNRYKLSKADADDRIKQYIQEKVCGKIYDSANINIQIGRLLSPEKLMINGKTFLNFNQIIEKITKNSKMLNDLTDIYDYPIHGDLTIDNIIVNATNNDFIILDPNNENAISDEVVDYAKLMQSLHSGYEFLRNLNSCKVDGSSITFKEVKSLQYEKLYDKLLKQLKSELPENRFRTLLFHEAVHYCRMLTYRCDINPETAPAFYAISIRLFNEFANQYE